MRRRKSWIRLAGARCGGSALSAGARRARPVALSDASRQAKVSDTGPLCVEQHPRRHAGRSRRRCPRPAHRRVQGRRASLPTRRRPRPRRTGAARSPRARGTDAARPARTRRGRNVSRGASAGRARRRDSLAGRSRAPTTRTSGRSRRSRSANSTGGDRESRRSRGRRPADRGAPRSTPANRAVIQLSIRRSRFAFVVPRVGQTQRAGPAGGQPGRALRGRSAHRLTVASRPVHSPLAEHTTLRLGGPAARVETATTTDELVELVRTADAARRTGAVDRRRQQSRARRRRLARAWSYWCGQAP